MTRDEIVNKIDKLEQKKWFLELSDEVNTKEYADIRYQLNDLRYQLKEEPSDECLE